MASAVPKDSRSVTSRTKRPRLTCVNCRTRKIRCDGAQPSCGICTAYSESCQYDKMPPMSQVLAMVERLKELEDTVEQLRGSKADPSPGPKRSLNRRIGVRKTPSSELDSHDSLADAMHLDQSKAYYDSTSAVDVPRGAGTNSLPTTSPHHTIDSRLDQHDQPDRNDLELWEEHAIANSASLLSLPPEKVRHLLAIHWTWVYPTFMFENRAMFLRDTAVGGEYFSPLLLTAICLHSTRFTDHELMQNLLIRTKILLGQAIHEKPSIPTAQALLEFSAHQVGKGNTSQAWLFGGMAFRMVIDLGYFSERSFNSADEQQLTRAQTGRKLAWSCFLWDKALSLYLGRAPTLPTAPSTQVESFNDMIDQQPWKPYAADNNAMIHAASPSNAAMCFSNLCALGEIVNEILLGIYSGNHTEHAGQFIKATRTKLEKWHENLPSALKFDDPPFLCPNTHVLTTM